MSLHPLVGHRSEQERVLRAVQENRLPQMILLTGDQGIGKQRFGLWLGQALLCEAPAKPCGVCQSCRMALELSHPDLHWLMPVPRPKAGEADKQVEDLEETISEVLAERRKDPLYPPADGMAGHFVSTARLLQRRAALTPAMGRKKVFLLAEADRLVPQESSQEAANALLKLLEEPPADTQLILTVVDPNRLLPTIRSRMVPLRLGRLTDAEVEEFLVGRAGKSAQEARHRAIDARGSIGQALSLGEETAKAEKAADELLRAVATGPQGRTERAMRQGVWAARGDFTAMLDALAGNLSDAARELSGSRPRRPVPEPLRKAKSVEALMEAQAKVITVRETAQGNVNPQLLLAVLLDDLAEVL
jgi:DNA polymerase-3 subunit delta'